MLCVAILCPQKGRPAGTPAPVRLSLRAANLGAPFAPPYIKPDDRASYARGGISDNYIISSTGTITKPRQRSARAISLLRFARTRVLARYR